MFCLRFIGTANVCSGEHTIGSVIIRGGGGVQCGGNESRVAEAASASSMQHRELHGQFVHQRRHRPHVFVFADIVVVDQYAVRPQLTESAGTVYVELLVVVSVIAARAPPRRERSRLRGGGVGVKSVTPRSTRRVYQVVDGI